VLGAHIAQTPGRMQQVPVVLAAQDTTEFNLTHLPATEGLGYGTGNNLRGFLMHSLLAVTHSWGEAPDDTDGTQHRQSDRPVPWCAVAPLEPPPSALT
jgi:hypothetical protein